MVRGSVPTCSSASAIAVAISASARRAGAGGGGDTGEGPALRFRDQTGDGACQFLKIARVAGERNAHGMEEGQGLEQVGQRGFLGHGRAVDQDRDDTRLAAPGALQPAGDLDPHPVVLVVEAAAAIFVRYGQPVWPNERQQNRALIDLLVNDLGEV